MSGKNSILRLLKDDVTHCLCCKCISKARPLSLIICAFASTLVMVGISFIFVGVAVATRDIPPSSMIEAYNSYASAYDPNSAFIGDDLLPANISVKMTNLSALVSTSPNTSGTDDNSSSWSSSIVVRNVTLSSVPYKKIFLDLDSDDVDMLYANPNEPAYGVTSAPCGIAVGSFTNWKIDTSFANTSSGRPPPPMMRMNSVSTAKKEKGSSPTNTFAFTDDLKVVPRYSDSSLTQQLQLQLAVTFSGANATKPILRTVNTTSYTVYDGPAYCSPIQRCTQRLMSLSCQKSYDCTDCYFLLQAPQQAEGLGISRITDQVDDEPVVCPTQGSPCGICVHEIYLSSYCLVISYNSAVGTYVEDPHFASCNWPFGPENQMFTRVGTFGDPAPNLSSVVVRTRNDPYLYLESLTNGTMTFLLDWPEFRSQGPLLVTLGLYFIVMGSIAACILCCYSRKLFCCNFCSARSDVDVNAARF